MEDNDLDMSTATVINTHLDDSQLVEKFSASYDEIPPLPRLSQSNSSVSSAEDSSVLVVVHQHQRQQQSSDGGVEEKNEQQPLPRSEQRPSRRALILGHAKSLLFVVIRFALKNNNWVLLINLVHHLWNARRLILNNRHVQWWSKDAARALGAMHLAFATLTGLALRERRRSVDRSALLVLLLAAVGQAWSYLTAYWRSGVRALRTTGLVDTAVFAITSVAFSKTLRPSARYRRPRFL